MLSSLREKFLFVKSCPADTAWIVGWLVKLKTNHEFQHSGWKGFMKSIHRNHGLKKSFIEYLPIIDGKPDSYSTVYTTLKTCLNTSKSKPIIITFDLPLWVKAMRIVLEMKMPVIVRLGGFHLLKSYLGCIGYIMKDSGLEELVQLIYPGSESIEHIMSGGAYYKALRVHFLIDAALCCYLIQNCFSLNELEEMEIFITICKMEYSDQISQTESSNSLRIKSVKNYQK